MSLYRYERQYHDMEPTQMAPGKIRQYPQNLALQSVMGRNLANTAWDVLAAKQQQGHEAMQRDEQIRMLSMQTGVPEVHLHSSVPARPPERAHKSGHGTASASGPCARCG